MSFECWQEVLDDYEKLFENNKGYDVIIYAGKNEDVKEFYLHSLILSARSQYFCTALSKENVEKKGGKIIFKKPGIPPQLFKIILRFIYCGKIDLTELEGPDLLKLITSADELDIHPLIPLIENYLVKHQSGYLSRNSVEILETVYQHESFTNLCNYCLEKICKEPEILFNSDEFINLKAPLLEMLLKRDDLNLDILVIWNSLLKWGLAKNPSISQDSNKWNKEETTIMERTLHRCIPLVRFHCIQPEDFLDKVYPLKELLPKDLVNNLLTFHIAPNRKLNIDMHPPRQPKFIYDSVLIESRHFAVFASWIDKKKSLHHNVMNAPYSFNLLYRASRDSNTVAAFHEKCDNKGANIVVVKITNSEQIIGGYNPLSWDQRNIIKSTRDSFIFSFTNRTNLQTAKVGYSNCSKRSIQCYSNYGPVFGGDLYCQTDGSWWHNGLYSYPNIDGIPTGKSEFNVDDYEVFQVKKT